MMAATKPTDRQTVAALRHVGAALGTSSAYVHRGRFHFRLDARWSLAISAEDAGRFRIAVFRDGRERAILWSLAGDLDRLADLALAARAEVLALAA
jgi:Tfp pilus assembly ATPase PilU